MGRGGRGGDQNKMMTAAAFLFSQHLAAAAAAPCSVLSSVEHQMTGKAFSCRAATARGGRFVWSVSSGRGSLQRGTKLQTMLLPPDFQLPDFTEKAASN